MKFKSVGIRLALLAVLSACSGAQDGEPAPKFVATKEIDHLLRAAEKSFRPEMPNPPIASEIPEAAAAARCIHPLLAEGPVSLQNAVRGNQREAFARTARELCGYQRWLEEEGPAQRTLDYSEDWHLTAVTEDLVSLSCDVTFYGGGAHSNYGYKTRTLWHDNGETREIGLEELFRPGPAWLDIVCARVHRLLLQAEASDVVSCRIPRIEERHLEFWRLSETGIEFLFAPYSVGCFAEGAYSALVEYDRVRELLDPGGPLGHFAR